MVSLLIFDASLTGIGIISYSVHANGSEIPVGACEGDIRSLGFKGEPGYQNTAVILPAAFVMTTRGRQCRLAHAVSCWFFVAVWVDYVGGICTHSSLFTATFITSTGNRLNGSEDGVPLKGFLVSATVDTVVAAPTGWHTSTGGGACNDTVSAAITSCKTME